MGGDEGNGGVVVTIAVYGAVCAWLLAITLDLLPAAFVAGPRHPTPFLLGHVRSACVIVLGSGSILGPGPDRGSRGGNKLVLGQAGRLLIGHIGRISGTSGPRRDGELPRGAVASTRARPLRGWPRWASRRVVGSRFCHGNPQVCVPGGGIHDDPSRLFPVWISCPVSVDFQIRARMSGLKGGALMKRLLSVHTMYCVGRSQESGVRNREPGAGGRQ